MAAVARRLVNRNLFKFKELTHCYTQNRCAGVFLLNLNLNDGGLFQTNKFQHKSYQYGQNYKVQLYSKASGCQTKSGQCEKKPSIFQRFKQMYKDYWYVLVPVHLVTSAAWFGGFYYLAKSGVDIVAILESLNISEKITSPLKDSSMGYLAVAYALYKVATPARYTVTLGGTTISINYLKKWGYIKPVPSTERLREMVKERKDNLLETMLATREGLKVQSEKLKDKKENIIDDLDNSIKQIKELGDKIKNSKEHVVEEVKKKSTKHSKD